MKKSLPSANSECPGPVGIRHSPTCCEFNFRPGILTLACFSALQAAPAYAGDFSGLGNIAPGWTSAATAVSADGGVVVGTAIDTNSNMHAFRWTASGGMVDMGGAYSFSQATGVSADGNVIAGNYNTGTGLNRAFRWTSAGFQTLGLASPYFDTTEAWGVSGNGNVVVGDMQDSHTGNRQAIAWRADGSTIFSGTLLGYNQSMATGTSYDGSVIVGGSWSSTGPGAEAFRYTQAGGMVGLGQLGSGNYSFANAVSSNGHVVVGEAKDSSGVSQAFRWTAGTGMVGLGTVPGWNSSSALGVSSDGAVVVGYGMNNNGSWEAVRWTSATGMRSVGSLLTAGGVNLGSWQLSLANSVSADGTTVVGYGTNPAGTTEAYIARIGTPSSDPSTGGSVLIGITDFTNSVASLSAVSRLSSEAARVGITNEVPGLSGLMGFSAAPIYQHVNGSHGDMGGAALTWRQPGLAVAGQVGTITAKTSDLHDGGRGDYRGWWAGLAASLSVGKLIGQPSIDGLELDAAARTGRYGNDIDRNYLNGISVETAHGSTTSRDTTLLARLGWRQPVTKSVHLTPYVQWLDNRTHIDAYDESGATLAGRVSAQKNRDLETSVGLSAAWQIRPELELRGRFSAVRLQDGTAAPVSVSVAGLGTFAAGGVKYDKNWNEFGIAADWAVSKRIRANAWATTTKGSNYPENWSAGVAVNFGL